MEVARGHAASYPLTLAAAETRLRLSALLAGASPDQDVTFQRVRVAPELAIAALSAEPVAEYGPILRSDRKSTRLNSSHPSISYAVFCLKKKKILLTRDFAV